MQLSLRLKSWRICYIFVKISCEDKPFNKDWKEQTVKWWQWLLSIPRESNPGIDTTGEKFDPYQFESNVIFLVGTYGMFIIVQPIQKDPWNRVEKKINTDIF